MSHNDLKKRVIALWNSNMTSGEIAAALNLSRGAVMGIVHRAKRMGLIKRAPRVKGPQPKKPAVVPQRVKTVTLAVVSIQREPEMPKKVKEPPQPELPLYRPKTIAQLGPFDCRWIRPDGKYCAHPAPSARTPWCDEHYKLVYVKGTGYGQKRPAVKVS